MIHETRMSLFALALVSITCMFLWLLGPILTPFLIGSFFAYALNPWVCGQARFGIPRSVGAFLTVVLLIVLVVTSVSMLLPLIESEILTLIHTMPEMTQKLLRAIQPRIEHLKSYLPPREIESANEFLRTSVVSVGHWFVDWLASLFRSGYAIANVLSWIVISPLVAFYLLRDWPHAIASARSYIPRTWIDYTDHLGHDINTVLAGYARGQALVCFVMALIYCCGLWLCQLKFALVIGLITGILTFIPYVGVLIGLTLALITGITQFSDSASLISLVAVFVVGMSFEGYFLTPRLVGGRIGLHPVWIIFAILAGGQLMGLVGILCAMPAAAIIRIVILDALRRYRSSAVYHGQTEP